VPTWAFDLAGKRVGENEEHAEGLKRGPTLADITVPKWGETFPKVD